MKKTVFVLPIILFLFAALSLSAYAGSPVEPSDAWLAAADSEILEAMTALINDQEFIESLDMPQSIQSMLVAGTEYTVSPEVVMYPPHDIGALLEALAPDEEAFKYMMADPGLFYDSYIRNTLISIAGTEALVMMSSAQLTDRLPSADDMLPTYALYTAADGADLCGILISHAAKGGVLTVSAQLIPASLTTELVDPASDVSFAFGYSGISLVYADEVFPEGTARIGADANAIIENANNEWLSEKALELAERLIAKAGTPAFVGLYTSDSTVLDICSQVGAIDLENAVVSKPDRVNSFTFRLLDIYTSSENGNYINKYFEPFASRIIVQSKINPYGVTAVAANAVCIVSDAWCADGSFKSCTVTISTGCSHDIAVSFGNQGNGVVDAIAQIIPAQ